MTDARNDLADNQGQQAPATVNNTVTPSEPKTEKMLSQSEVDRLVGNARREAREKGRNDAYAEFQQQTQQQYQSQQPQQQTNMGGIPQLDENAIKELLKKVAPEVVPDVLRSEANKLHNKQIADSFVDKINSGHEKYADFEEIVAPLDLVKLAPLVPYLNSMDNTVDVVYELGKNPGKAIVMMNAIMSGTPHLAELEMKKLSHSIKQNESASQAKTANDPLGQVKPSNAGNGSGSMTVKDLRRQGWMKV